MTRRVLLLGILFLVFAAPIAVLVLYGGAGLWRYPNLLPESYSLRALRYVGGQGGTLARSLLSSLGYSLATVLLTFVICVVPASVMARERFRGKRLLEALLLAPALVPPITFTMGVHYVFIRAGLADSYLGVVLVLAVFSYPYMLRALTAGFMAYGPEYDVCAKNLGASLIERLVRVELPLLAPSVVSGGTVVFLVAFSDYFLVFLIGGGAVASYTGFLFPFLAGSDRSIAAVFTLIFLAVPLVLFATVDATVQRSYRRKGLSQGV